MSELAVLRGKTYMPVYIDREVLLECLEEYRPTFQKYRECECGKLGEYLAPWRDKEPYWLCADCYEADLNQPEPFDTAQGKPEYFIELDYK